MPDWEGIEDASAKASRVWFTRDILPTDLAVKVTEEEEWKPLRKKDCQALNQYMDRHVGAELAQASNEQARASTATVKHTVYIEGGRATADLTRNIVYDNYDVANLKADDNEEDKSMPNRRQLCSAIWFRKEEKSSKEFVLHPISNDVDSLKIEALYQTILSATSSLGSGLSSILNETAELQDGSKVMVIKTSKNHVKLIVKNAGWFAPQYDLQRGYGEYTVVGEEEETTLGDVGHLVFVIHGIGESYFRRDEVRISSIVEQLNGTRVALHAAQIQKWKDECQRIQRSNAFKKKGGEEEEVLPPPPERIELLPIEWFQHVHDSSTSLMKTLRSSTLQTIPALRAIANDVILDVLLYLTPAFCQAVLECVTDQICQYYAKFLEINPNFQGKCSIIGHSLGSVITWDLLSILKEKEGGQTQENFRGVSIAKEEEVEVGYQAYVHPGEQNADSAIHGTWGPSLTKAMKKTIPFVPECTILLGSPMGLFLTLRGCHPVFDEMRQRAVEKVKNQSAPGKIGVDQEVSVPAASPFTLPTNSLYNIYHPSDPVAYRIEPLLLSPDLQVEDLPPAVYLTAPGKDVRLHVKAKLIGDELRKNLAEQKSAWNALIDTTIKTLGAASTAQATVGEVAKADGSGQKVRSEWPPNFPLGNPTNPVGARVDHTFQPGVVENEYINAVMAHSNYFHNSDLQDFLITRLSMKSDTVSSRIDADGNVVLSNSHDKSD